jgi:hypothetical protein
LHRFLDDLDRWRLYVPYFQKQLFDEIALSVWDKDTNYKQTPLLYSADDLSYIQQLVCNLISETAFEMAMPNSTKSRGERLDIIQDRFTSLTPIAAAQIDPSTVSVSDSSATNPEGIHDEPFGGLPLDLAQSKPLDVDLVWLISGAIFSIFIAFLLRQYPGHPSAILMLTQTIVWNYGAAGLFASGFFTDMENGEKESSPIPKRTCKYLLLYFGLGRTILPSWDFQNRRWWTPNCEEGNKCQDSNPAPDAAKTPTAGYQWDQWAKHSVAPRVTSVYGDTAEFSSIIRGPAGQGFDLDRSQRTREGGLDTGGSFLGQDCMVPSFYSSLSPDTGCVPHVQVDLMLSSKVTVTGTPLFDGYCVTKAAFYEQEDLTGVTFSLQENPAEPCFLDQDKQREINSVYSTSATSTTSSPRRTAKPPSSGARLYLCRGCGKPFPNVGNRNRHYQTDCPNGPRTGFPCRNPGCERKLTRKEFRDRHERKHCGFK